MNELPANKWPSIRENTYSITKKYAALLGSSQLEKPPRITKLSETGIGFRGIAFRVYLGRQYGGQGHILP